MDDSTSTPAQKRPRVAEENRKRAVRAYVLVLPSGFFELPFGTMKRLTNWGCAGAMDAAG
jgi:hypothetical protein